MPLKGKQERKKERWWSCFQKILSVCHEISKRLSLRFTPSLTSIECKYIVSATRRSIGNNCDPSTPVHRTAACSWISECLFHNCFVVLLRQCYHLLYTYPAFCSRGFISHADMESTENSSRSSRSSRRSDAIKTIKHSNVNLFAKKTDKNLTRARFVVPFTRSININTNRTLSYNN